MTGRWRRKWAQDRETDKGLNAARVFGVDPAAHRNPVPHDYVARLKADDRDEGPRPSLAQYNWVRQT